MAETQNSRLVEYRTRKSKKETLFFFTWFVSANDDKSSYHVPCGTDITSWVNPSDLKGGNTIVLVSKSEAESLIPHQTSGPWIVKIEASDNLGNRGGQTTLLDVHLNKFYFVPITLKLEWFGITEATQQQAGWRKVGDDYKRLEELAVLNIDGKPAKEKDLIFANASKTDKGSAKIQPGSPYKEDTSLANIKWGKVFVTNELRFETTHYKKGNVNDVIMKLFEKTNGDFPQDHRPHDNAGAKWLCSNELVEEVKDMDGDDLLKITRTFRYSSNKFKWNTDLFPTWSSW